MRSLFRLDNSGGRRCTGQPTHQSMFSASRPRLPSEVSYIALTFSTAKGWEAGVQLNMRPIVLVPT
jgi:hypothetical protein